MRLKTDRTDELRIESLNFERRENLSLNVLKEFSSRAIFSDEIPVSNQDSESLEYR